MPGSISYLPRTMRLLLLTLVLLALLPQVIPDDDVDKRCSSLLGICKNKCEELEVAVASGTGTTKETITIEYDMSSDFMDVLT
uniref:beta-defensin 118-like n=1 Tax=Arvicanthis niloticus TaxID=61156 RepID=UPI00148661D4|nr:beta-defensin 118-like [Arvicanthis niloticus]